MKTFVHKFEKGWITGSTIAIIGLSVLFVAAGSFSIWAYVNYSDQKNNVDSKISIAVAEAKKQQGDEDEKKFAEREKEPLRRFIGPDDYGRLEFSYSKTWSVYVGTDTTKGGTYTAFLNPITVPPVGPSQQYALRVTIEEKDYDAVVKTYEHLVKNGELRSTPASIGGHNGTRFDGNFTKDIRGAAVLFKIRDKTATVRTDADIFKPDFENLIKTISFNT